VVYSVVRVLSLLLLLLSFFSSSLK